MPLCLSRAQALYLARLLVIAGRLGADRKRLPRLGRARRRCRGEFDSMQSDPIKVLPSLTFFPCASDLLRLSSLSAPLPLFPLDLVFLLRPLLLSCGCQTGGQCHSAWLARALYTRLVARRLTWVFALRQVTNSYCKSCTTKSVNKFGGTLRSSHCANLHAAPATTCQQPATQLGQASRI